MKKLYFYKNSDFTGAKLVNEDARRYQNFLKIIH